MARKDRRRATTEARIALRKRVLELRKQGKSLAKISAITGYAATYCSTLCRKYVDRPEELAGLARGGRPIASGRVLTAVQERRIRRWVCLRLPDQLRLPYTLWTRRAVQALIVRRCGVKLSARAVRGYLLRWGYAAQAPPKRLGAPGWARWGHLDCGQYPAIAMRARLEGAEICWGVQTIVDGGGSRRDICRDTRTERLRPRARPRAQGLVAAISNRGKIRFMICGEPPTAVELVAFLRRLTMDANRKVFLILDNLLLPASGSIGEWLKSHRAQIEVFKLPRYAPQPVTVHSHLTPTHRRRVAVTQTSRMQANLPDT